MLLIASRGTLNMDKICPILELTTVFLSINIFQIDSIWDLAKIKQ